MNAKRIFPILLVTLSVLSGCSSGREMVVLSDGWKLWQDKQAVWQHDSLYLPAEVVISKLAKDAIEPTGGWNVLDGRPDGTVDVRLPAIVEEYLTPDGKVDTYMPGVYWFWKDVDIPKSYSGKTVRLHIESSRLRTEVFVNRQLTGYDIVGDVPYNCDLTGALHYGKTNRIAIRITNPGGNKRGWEDFPHFNWGEYMLPASRNFGGINGNVELVVTGRTFIEDVYIKNLNTSDYRSIEVQTTVNNQHAGETKAQIKYDIIPVAGGRAVFTATDEILIAGNSSQVFTKQIHCPEAALWNIETPALYQCRVSVRSSEKTGEEIHDVFNRKFGFRVFEVKKVEGNNQAHWYVNGKRIIFKGGIDFSYYAYTGAYPTDEAATKSILAAKQLGHNALNFHRRIGCPLILDKADALGLLLYEEVGGFHTGGQGYDITQSSFASALIIEKLRRMVLRDRNHPSLIIYNLSNEDAQYGELRKKGLECVHALDEARLVVNSSGSAYESGQGKCPDVPHIRPYENHIRTDFHDDHTVGSGILFDENDFEMHVPADNEHAQYWGEVKGYSAPDNWCETAGLLEKLKSQKTKDYKGYNYSYYIDFGKKLHDFFREHRMASTGSGVIRTPGDISKVAGNGKMYSEGRNAQNIMSYDRADGYAINAWSGGNGLETWSGWYSGLVDDGRNIKGDPAIYAYYTRPLQVVIQRRTGSAGGKFFDISGTATFKIKLINQGILSAGDYTLRLKLKDGAGIYHPEYNRSIPVRVQGNDVYAQDIDLAYTVPMNERLHGGFITLEGALYDSHDKIVTDGAEQILLANRPSFAGRFKDITVAVHEWDAARKALQDANAKVVDFVPDDAKVDYIAAAGNVSPETLDAMLEKVKSGATLLVKIDSLWAARLRSRGILSEDIVEWGTPQSGGWIGNGFGYIDHFSGDTGLLGSRTISLNSWEVDGKGLNGFYPFKSKYTTSIHGVYVARPDVIRVLIGAIDYGKGRILLNAAYPVDMQSPLNDLLFYNQNS
jgi:hypothetical protein